MDKKYLIYKNIRDPFCEDGYYTLYVGRNNKLVEDYEKAKLFNKEEVEKETAPYYRWYGWKYKEILRSN